MRVAMLALVARASAAATASVSRIRPPAPSPTQWFNVRGHDVLVKRDDQYRLSHEFGAGVAGNKARKLYELAETGPGAAAVASLGGHQSNAAPCLAALCHARKTPFFYICKPVPRWLRKTPAGNYARALALGAILVPLQAADYRRCIADEAWRTALLADVAEAHDVDGAVRWVPQGGACGDAEAGVAMLAEELSTDLADLGGARVVLPAGTGTTALFLARHLASSDVEVCAVPCAMRAPDLRRSMEKLDAATGGAGTFPTLLDAERPGEAPLRFGAPDERLLGMWKELAVAGLHVDLVYAPAAWDALLRDLERGGDARPTCYVHCGGIAGVATQLARYRHAGLVGDRDLE